MTRPTLTFIGGANGSGKTTLTRWNSDLFQEIPVLDPDTLGSTLQSTTSAAFPIASARRVLQSAKTHISEGTSFAVETTLAGRNYLRMMLDARRSGFEIVLVYIGTENVEINLARIRNRVLAGGHDVPEQDVRRGAGPSFLNLICGVPRPCLSVLWRDRAGILKHPKRGTLS
ncbi:MAG: zeta toxin family protein [Acidobacteriia bacterium]|nr:zeta toxin family protein [Terriglobia bacterium]